MRSTSRLLLERSTVSNNTSIERWPAVDVFGANSVLHNSTISNNTSPTHTGGVEIWAAAVTISSCTLAGSSAAVCDIGAVELAGAGEIFVEGFECGHLAPWSATVW